MWRSLQSRGLKYAEWNGAFSYVREHRFEPYGEEYTFLLSHLNVETVDVSHTVLKKAQRNLMKNIGFGYVWVA